MHKDELIQLHTLLAQVKKHFESTLSIADQFREYETYGVSPQHIHKSKLQHKRAVFLLGKNLAQTIGGTDEFSNGHKVSIRLADLAKKVAHKTEVGTTA